MANWERAEIGDSAMLIGEFKSFSGRETAVFASGGVACVAKCPAEKHFLCLHDFEADPARSEFAPIAWANSFGGVETAEFASDLFDEETIAEISRAALLSRQS